MSSAPCLLICVCECVWAVAAKLKQKSRYIHMYVYVYVHSNTYVCKLCADPAGVVSMFSRRSSGDTHGYNSAKQVLLLYACTEFVDATKSKSIRCNSVQEREKLKPKKHYLRMFELVSSFDNIKKCFFVFNLIKEACGS